MTPTDLTRTVCRLLVLCQHSQDVVHLCASWRRLHATRVWMGDVNIYKVRQVKAWNNGICTIVSKNSKLFSEKMENNHSKAEVQQNWMRWGSWGWYVVWQRKIRSEMNILEEQQESWSGRDAVECSLVRQEYVSGTEGKDLQNCGQTSYGERGRDLDDNVVVVHLEHSHSFTDSFDNHWTTMKGWETRLEVHEMRMLRWMCAVTKQDKTNYWNNEIIASVRENWQRNYSNGHVMRREEEHILRRILEAEMSGKRRGEAKKTVEGCM